MKHISKKIWFGLSVAIVAMSAVFALKKPVQKEKCSHVVVDRLVNQLVCKYTTNSGGSRNYPRGFLGFTYSKDRCQKRPGRQRGDRDEYTLRSSHKVVAKGHERIGRQRNDKPRRPIGGDF